MEQAVEGFQVDVLKNGTVVEVQLGKLAALRRKLRALSSVGYAVLVVLPIQAVVTTPVRRKVAGRSRSYLRTYKRKRASFLEAFRELVHFPELLTLPGVKLELLLLHEQRVSYAARETVWRGRRARTRFLDALNRDTTVVEVLGRRVIQANEDLLELLPASLPSRFSNRDLAGAANVSYALASMTTYTLSRIGALREAGREGRRNLYTFTSPQRVPSRREDRG